MHADISERPRTRRPGAPTAAGRRNTRVRGAGDALVEHPFRFPGSLALACSGATGIPSAFLTQSAPLATLVALATAGCIVTASVMIEP